MGEWQSIKTAPKSGSYVLLFVPDDDDGEIYKVGYWSDLAARAGWFFRGGWIDEKGPTHWAPLKPPVTR